jgi:hypothetical protein
MKFAYADPPYFGLAQYYTDRHPDALEWNRIETHKALIQRLCEEYPDGWALSLHTPSLRDILPLCPGNVRVMAWVKPFCSFKPGVNPAYAWEPVIVFGGRNRGRDLLTVRDWIATSITLQRGFVGAKPEEFCFWVFEILGMEPEDEFEDMFPGSGAVSRAFIHWKETYRRPSMMRFFEEELPLINE